MPVVTCDLSDFDDDDEDVKREREMELIEAELRAWLAEDEEAVQEE